MSGVKSESAAIWLGAVTAAVNFAFTFVGIYLVEKIGRRPLTLTSLVGTMSKLFYGHLSICQNIDCSKNKEATIQRLSS